MHSVVVHTCSADSGRPGSVAVVAAVEIAGFDFDAEDCAFDAGLGASLGARSDAEGDSSAGHVDAEKGIQLVANWDVLVGHSDSSEALANVQTVDAVGIAEAVDFAGLD